MKLQIDYREEKALNFKFFFFKNCRANKTDTGWIHMITTLGSSEKQRGEMLLVRGWRIIYTMAQHYTR